MKVQAIGVCRFSLLTTAGFKSGPQSQDERAAYLFEDRRMAIRMAWFRHVVVPSIRAQTDRDFTFVVLTSTLLPQKWRDQLSEAVEGVSEIELDFADPGKHYQLANNAIIRRIAPETDVVAQFRLDDDDAVAHDYIHRVRQDFDETLLPLYRRFNAVCSDYSNGFVLDTDGNTTRFLRLQVTTWPCAQTVYLPANSKQALFSWGHHQLHSVMPTVTFCDGNMFMRGRHSENDSGVRVRAQDNVKEWGTDALMRRFGINLADLQSALRQIT